VVVLGLLLYSISARDPSAPPNAYDVLQVVLIVSHCWPTWSRCQPSPRARQFSFTPNRGGTQAQNMILLAAWDGRPCSCQLPEGQRHVRQPGEVADATAPARLRNRAAIVVILFPPLFGYV
jgi:hypothetical protein